MDKGIKYSLFLGCTIPARGRNYELSARKVASRLGIELVDIKDFVCCGFPLKNADLEKAELLSAYNISLSGNEGLPLCTLCSSCTSALTETAHHLSTDGEAIKRINEGLKRLGLSYKKDVKIRHFVRVLFEKVGEARIKEQIVKELKGLRVAVHYGCHYLKPSEIYNEFDNPEDPKSIDALVRITGAEVIDYSTKKMCCGGPILPVDEEKALSMAKQKLDDVSKQGADIICLVCPFCSVMYDSNQKGIESKFETSYNIPVLYLTQLLGIAMGFERKELGLNMNVVKTKKLLSRFYE